MSHISPLASILRPKSLDDIIGQKHLFSVGKPLRKYIEAGKVPSMILW